MQSRELVRFVFGLLFFPPLLLLRGCFDPLFHLGHVAGRISPGTEYKLGLRSPTARGHHVAAWPEHDEMILLAILVPNADVAEQWIIPNRWLYVVFGGMHDLWIGSLARNGGTVDAGRHLFDP